MKLPRWLRKKAANVLAFWSGEYGGVLYDYKNGLWEKVAEWKTQKESDDALSVVENALTNGRDGIYVAMIKAKTLCGYFIIEDSTGGFQGHGFWNGIYEFEEAIIDVMKECRKIADKMGYRRPDETLGHS